MALSTHVPPQDECFVQLLRDSWTSGWWAREDRALSDSGSRLGLGSALDRISWVTREASPRDKPEGGPHVTSGPQQNEHVGYV